MFPRIDAELDNEDYAYAKFRNGKLQVRYVGGPRDGEVLELEEVDGSVALKLVDGDYMLKPDGLDWYYVFPSA